MSGPVMPVRTIRARLDAKTGKWLSCKKTDLRGTLILQVDALGRGVQGIYSNPYVGRQRILGWKLQPVPDEEQAERFRLWMESNPEMEIVK